MGRVIFASVYRLSDSQKISVIRPQFDDDGLAQGRVRNAIAKDDPPSFRRPLARPGVRDVNGLVLTVLCGVAGLEDGECFQSRIIAHDAIRTPGGILGPAKGDKEDRADEDPQYVDGGESR
jgi:hypothetical protein